MRFPAGAAAAIVLFLAGCTGYTTPSAQPASAPAAGGGAAITGQAAQVNDHGTTDVRGKSEVELEADTFYFEPTILRGSPGQRLKLEVDNESGALHSFTTDAGPQRMDVDLPAKQKKDVDISFPTSGTVEFYCKYHRGMGMAGRLEVASS